MLPYATQISIGDFKTINRVWCAHVAAVVTVMPGWVGGKALERTHGNLQAWLGLRNYAEWLIRSWSCRDISWTMERVKAFYDWCRWRATFSVNEPPVVPCGFPGSDGLSFKPDRLFKGTLAALSAQEGADGAYFWFQFSLAKRALPEAGLETQIKTLRKHKVNMETLVETSPVVLERMEDYAKEWVRKSSAPVRKGNLPLSAAGSLEHSRRDGGRALGVRELLEKSRHIELPPLPVDRPLYSIFGEEKLINNAATHYHDCYRKSSFEEPDHTRVVRDMCLEELFFKIHDFENHPIYFPSPDFGESPFLGFYLEPPEWTPPDWYELFGLESHAETVCEQGYKARIVTKSQEALSNLLHILRGMIFGPFHEDPTMAIEESKGQEAINLYNSSNRRKHGGRSFRTKSSDLNTATDRIAFDIAKSMGKGIRSGFEEDPRTTMVDSKILRLLMPLIAQSHRIKYPRLVCRSADQSGWIEEEADQKRGLLMGLATSWLFLNLYSKFGFEYSEELAGESPSPPPTMFPRWDLRICGDDILSHVSDSHGVIFDFVMTDLLHAKLSPGVDSTSDRFGVFTEALIDFRGPGGKACWVDIYRCKSFVGVRGRAPVRRLGEAMTEVPAEWAYGLAVSSALRWASPEIRDQVTSYFNFYHHSLLVRVEKCGIPKYLPRWAGGYEAPHRLDTPISALDPRYKRFLGALLRPDQSVSGLRKLESPARFWMGSSENLIASRAEELIDIFLSIYKSEAVPIDHVAVALGLKAQGSSVSLTDRVTYTAVFQYMEHRGYVSYMKWVDTLRLRLIGRLQYTHPFPRVTDIPKMSSIGRSLQRMIKDVLSEDPYPYATPWKSYGDVEVLRQRKLSSVFLPLQLLEGPLSAFVCSHDVGF